MTSTEINNGYRYTILMCIVLTYALSKIIIRENNYEVKLSSRPSISQLGTIFTDSYIDDWSIGSFSNFITPFHQLEIQPCKYQLSNSQVSDNSKPVVKDKKLTVHNSYPGAI